MAVAVIWLDRPLAWWIDSSSIVRAGRLAMIIAAGAVTYGLVLLSLGLRISHLGMRPR
jgi:hypothetical protein